MSRLAKKKLVYIYRDNNYNDNNHWELAPFMSNDEGKTLKVEKEVYHKWVHGDTIDILKEIFDDVLPTDCIEPLQCDFWSDLPDWYIKTYKAISSRTEATRWHNALKPNHILFPICASDLDVNRESLMPRLKIAMAKTPVPSKGWFVKCGTCSTKHQYPPEPIFSAAEAIAHLLGANPVISAIASGRAKSLLFIPWNDSISDVSEVRVFVRNNVVVGVSQQSCYRIHPVIHLFDPTDVISAFQIEWNRINTHISPQHRYYNNCTFDGYISTNNDALHGNLIEINSEGFGWGPAGAALFSWLYNPPPQDTESPVFAIAALCEA